MNRRQFLTLGAVGAVTLVYRGVPSKLCRALAAGAPGGYTLQIEFGLLDVMTLRLAPPDVAPPTVFGLLRSGAAVLGLHLAFADYGASGLLITGLRGRSNTAAFGWHLFRNGQWINRSASRAELQAGDSVIVRYRAVAPEFIRGDSNADGEVDVSDVIASLQHKFGGRPSPCPDAADADDDGALTLGDDLGLLRYLFLQGPNPSAPYPYPGPDPTSDALGCRW